MGSRGVYRWEFDKGRQSLTVAVDGPLIVDDRRDLGASGSRRSRRWPRARAARGTVHLRWQAGAGARGLVPAVPGLLPLLPEPTTAAGGALGVDQDASFAELDPARSPTRPRRRGSALLSGAQQGIHARGLLTGALAAYREGEAESRVAAGGKARILIEEGELSMRATVMYGAGDVRVENVPGRPARRADRRARRASPAPASAAATSGRTSRWRRARRDAAWATSSSALVEAVGSDVRTVKKGDLVVAPFAWSDGTCEFCRQGLQTSCLHGGCWGGTELDGGQGEAVRVPQADGTLVALPVGPDHALMPSLLTLSDVMGTGHHARARREGRAGQDRGRRRRRRGRACAASSPRAGSAPSGSSCSAVTPTASRWRASSARRTSSASAAMRRSSACAS